MNEWVDENLLDSSLNAGIYYLITYILEKPNNKLYNMSGGNKCYQEKYSIGWTIKVDAV